MELLLRIPHIVFGTFWAGTSFFIALVLLPLLRALGPKMERSFWSALFRSPAMVLLPISALVTAGTGIAIALRYRAGQLNVFFTTSWGWAILVSFIATIAYLVIAFTIDNANTAKMKRLFTSIEGRDPNTDEAKHLAQTSSRMTTIVWTEFGLMLLTVAAMAAARFI